MRRYKTGLCTFIALYTINHESHQMILGCQVLLIHSRLIRWMVDLLLLMVPVHSNDQVSLPSAELNIIVDVSAEKLDKDASVISEKLDYLSKYITR